MCDNLDALCIPDDDLQQIALRHQMWAVRRDEPLDETIARHAELVDLLAELHAYERDLATDTGARVADHVDAGETYITADGIPCHWSQPKTERWDGARLLRHLCRDLTDPDTSQPVPAVPLRTLVDVLPAVEEGKTSSRWRTIGLAAHGIKARDFRTVEYGPPRLAAGFGHRKGVGGPGAEQR